MKHWYHLTSADLVDWQEEGVALIPEFPHESHGIFSGTGLVKDNQLYLFYTGNHRDEKWQRHSSQCLAILSSDGKIEKLAEPVISGPPQHYTHNFRDPKVFKKGNHYYMLVGAQRESLEGCLLVYVSDDLKSWKFKQELKTNRELSIKNGRIQQQPIQELKQKRVKTNQHHIKVVSSRERLKTIYSEVGEYRISINVGTAERVGIAFRVGDDEETVCLLD